MIQVGYKYTYKEKFTEEKVTVHILHKREGSGRPFLGFIEKSNRFEFLDKHGQDEWMMCGGNWINLDMKSKEKSEFSIKKEV